MSDYIVALAVAFIAEKAAVAETKLEEIHVLVNSRLTEALNRIDELEMKLGIPPARR